MAKLQARAKIVLILFRRVNPDEVLLSPFELKRSVRWGMPFTQAQEGESAAQAARRLAEDLVGIEVLAPIDLAMPATYRVKEGPNAGEWTEHYFAVEAKAGSRARIGRWLPHFEAKATSEVSRVREAITRLRDEARLKP